jgi:glycosyltransferase involved in cell wall biosynthesis
LKFLEAGMLEIPVIAQSFDHGPYEEITDDMGILIKDNSQWREEIEKLISNKELRRSMGKQAREYVIKNYNIADHAHKWADAYNNLCK